MVIIKVSVIIPVFNTSEALLHRCLCSVCAQSGVELEIIVVDDGVESSCKQLVTKYALNDSRIRYVRHWRNKGLVEVRRTGCKNAHGEYILAVDSDDELLDAHACAMLYARAQQENADIVQCGARVVVPDSYKNTENRKTSEKGQVPDSTTLEGSAIFENMFLHNGHSTFLWAKLIKKSLYLKAFAHIPRIFCVQSEDFLQYFFISYYAKKYSSIPDQWYSYYVGSGISTSESITSLSTWKAICSSAKIFDILWRFIKTYPHKPIYEETLSKHEQAQLFFTLRRFYTLVDTSITSEAWHMLCNAWGTQKVYCFNKAVQDSNIHKNVP